MLFARNGFLMPPKRASCSIDQSKTEHPYILLEQRRHKANNPRLGAMELITEPLAPGVPLEKLYSATKLVMTLPETTLLELM